MNERLLVEESWCTIIHAGTYDMLGGWVLLKERGRIA